MRATSLSCRECHRKVAIGGFYQCPWCGGSLEVDYDLSGLSGEALVVAPPAGLGGLWRFHELLPISGWSQVVSLGEGGTPLVIGRRSGELLGTDVDLRYKLELVAPSGSFKDRPVSVAVSKARELGFETIVVASTGNTSASAAMYAARAGLKCVVCVPDGTELEKMGQALAHGAVVTRIRGTYSDAYGLARAAAERYGWCNISTTFINPYTVEGDKTLAFELWLQMGRAVPDWVLIPIGAGPFLVGVFKGFQELMAIGATDRVPRLVGVQARSCAPIAEAFEKGLPRVLPWKGGTETVAHAIADPLTGYERDGDVTLGAVNASRGEAVAVAEEEIGEARVFLSAREGIYAEPSSATVLAAARTLARAGRIRSGESAVCVVTGHGLKSTQTAGGAAPLVTRAEDLPALLR